MGRYNSHRACKVVAVVLAAESNFQSDARKPGRGNERLFRRQIFMIDSDREAS